MPREVTRELAAVLVDPIWEDIAWFSALDVALARDRDVTTELLDEHLAVTGVKRADWDRMQFLRKALTPAHRPQLVKAIEGAPRHGLVELLAWTCTTAKELTSALREAGAGKALAPAIDYALRRFVHEPAVAKQLWRRAQPYATTAARGSWKQEGTQAWRALYVTDTRESADAVRAMTAATWRFTDHGPKERLVAAAAKRARLLAYGSRCVAPLLVALPEIHTDIEITHSAVALRGNKVRRALETKWNEYKRYARYTTASNPAGSALGGLLAVAPRVKAYQEAARAALPTMLKLRTPVSWRDIALVNGIVMGIVTGRVKPLYPLLETVTRWRAITSAYDNHGTARGALALALLRRRARRALDAG